MAACGGLGPQDAQRAELDANRARWSSLGPDSYVYAMQRLCYCAVESIGPVRITVEADTVTERVYVETGQPVPEVARTAFPTVDGLFEILERAMEDGAYEIRVTYDPDLGVPIDFWIDFLENAVDEELGVQVTESVEVLPQL